MCTKGSFFIDMDGLISSHEYKLQIPRDSDVFITIYPVVNKKGTGRNFNLFLSIKDKSREIKI